MVGPFKTRGNIVLFVKREDYFDRFDGNEMFQSRVRRTGQQE